MRIFNRITPVVFTLLCMTATVLAQPDQCPTIVRAALEATDEVCSAVGRNQACYGNTTLEAEPHEGTAEFQFSQPGDVIDLANVLALRLTPLDEETEEWGVALMRIQANLPETLPGQNVTFVLFGDVEITEAAPAGDGGETSPPMQAFYFTSGLNDAPCTEAPDSGILIQTPGGGRTIELTVNEVDISLGSTAYFQGQPSEDMTISVIEGEATMTAEGETVVVPAGSQSTVPLDEDGAASGPPTEPEPYDAANLAALPLSLLDREIAVVDAEATAQIGFGSGIQPVGGEWVSTSSVASAEGCPAGMAEMMAGAGGTPQSFTLPDGPFSLEQVLLSSDTAGMLTNGIYSSPDSDTYVAEFDVEGSQIRYEVRVISPTQMEGETIIVVEGCTLVIPFVATAAAS